MSSRLLRQRSRCCGVVAAQNFYDLQPDAGLMLISNVAPKLCERGHFLLRDARAEAS